MELVNMISNIKNYFKNKKEKNLENNIRLLELKQEKQAYKKLLNSGKFSKRTIIFCLAFTSIFALLCLYVQYKTGYETYSLLRIIGAVFGGELLLLLFKRIYNSDDNKINTYINRFKDRKIKTDNMDITIPPNSEIGDEVRNMIDQVNSNIDGGVG